MHFNGFTGSGMYFGNFKEFYIATITRPLSLTCILVEINVCELKCKTCQ